MQGSYEGRGREGGSEWGGLFYFQIRFAATGACQITKPRSDINSEVDSPVEIGGLDITQSLRLARADEYHIRRYEIVVLQTDDIANLDVLPFPLLEYGLGSEDFGFARVELSVRLVSFLYWVC